MNRDEALKLLKGGEKGVREWNRRRDERESIPSLKGAELTAANLSRVNLNASDLSYANLSGAILWEADLFRADLNYANLRDSDLTDAFLHGANLSDADLSGTTLYRTNLIHSKLRNTVVRGTHMDSAQVGNTIFACDLSEANGADEIKHLAPSIVDTNSILHFRDDLPEKFLRGCGLREEEIAHFRGQVGKPIRFYTCFISYSTADEEFATRLHNDFQAAGIRCWKWDKDAVTGKSMWGEIDNAIRRFDKLVLIASQSSMKSPLVMDEIERAIQKERDLITKKNAGQHDGETDVLFPVRLDDYILDDWDHERRVDVTKKVIADARNWHTDAGQYADIRDRLVKHLKA